MLNVHVNQQINIRSQEKCKEQGHGDTVSVFGKRFVCIQITLDFWITD